MKSAKIILSIVVVVAALFVLSATMPQVRSLFVGSQSIKAVYVNPANGASVNVTYNNQTATLDSQSYKGVVFNQVESASGARYENKEQNLVLWNKGDEVVIYKNDSPIFSGKTQPTTVE